MYARSSLTNESLNVSVEYLTLKTRVLNSSVIQFLRFDIRATNFTRALDRVIILLEALQRPFAPLTVEKICHLTFGSACASLSHRRLSSCESVKKLPDDEMHDYTPTDTENVHWATLTYFAVNFTCGESGTKTYTGRHGDATRYVTFARVLWKDKGKHIRISSGILLYS